MSARAHAEDRPDPRATLASSALAFITPGVRASACQLPLRGVASSLALPLHALGPKPWLAAGAPLLDPVTGRGVLLDMAGALRRPWLEPQPAIQPRDLDECSERQGVVMEPGDLLLIRTGWLGRAVQDGDFAGYQRGAAPGLAATCARWLEDRRIALAAADTAWVEARPVAAGAVALRPLALERLGLVLGGGFHLDPLAELCAADGNYAFLLVIPPPAELGVTHPVALK